MNNNYLPNARQQNLVVQVLPDELLVYDLAKNKVFCLNQTAKIILEQCDGRTTFAEAKANIQQELNAEISDEILWIALGQLKSNGLLDNTQPFPEIPKVSRRQIMQSGIALSIALPIITSLVAPSVVNAQSDATCIQSGGLCTVTGLGMDNCCLNNSCTMEVGGVCCIIAFQTCDPLNDLCCPGTACDILTNTCLI